MDITSNQYIAISVAILMFIAGYLTAPFLEEDFLEEEIIEYRKLLRIAFFLAIIFIKLRTFLLKEELKILKEEIRIWRRRYF